MVNPELYGPTSPSPRPSPPGRGRSEIRHREFVHRGCNSSTRTFSLVQTDRTLEQFLPLLGERAGVRASLISHDGLLQHSNKLPFVQDPDSELLRFLELRSRLGARQNKIRLLAHTAAD